MFGTILKTNSKAIGATVAALVVPFILAWFASIGTEAPADLAVTVEKVIEAIVIGAAVWWAPKNEEKTNDVPVE